MNHPIDWPTLNAYVDGELSAADAAEVARAVAENEDLAHQVAVLTAMKAAVAASAPSFGPLQANKPRRARVRYAAFAAMLLGLIGALLVVVVDRHHAGTPEDRDIALTLAAHTAWRANRQQSSEGSAHAVSSSLTQLNLNAYIPDLSPVDLRFSGISELPEGVGIHVGYEGRHGCTVSLTLFRTVKSLETPLQSVEYQGQVLHQWQAAGTRFLLVATGMDPERLARTAAVVHRLTLQRLPLDPAAVVALNEARSGAKPCLG